MGSVRGMLAVFAAVLMLGMLFAAAPSAMADEYRCRGSVGARTLDNVVVPSGATCSLSGTTVKGNINVQLDSGRAFTIQASKIGGSIQTVANNGSSKIARNYVGADVQVFSHRNGIAIGSNSVDGNLQCKENVPAPTGSGNVVQGNKEDQCRRL